MRNKSGYNDPTASRAMRKTFHPRTVNTNTISKPVPENNVIHFDDHEHPVYDVFMHYKGYHNPEYGEWISVCATSFHDAELKAESIPTKKPAEKAYMRRRP